MKGLKGLLQVIGFGAVAYVAAIAAIIAIQIAPTAKALRDHSERVRQEYQTVNDRSAALYATMDEIQMWLSTVARPTALKAGLDLLRRRVDSLTTPVAGPHLSGIPTAMRVEFAQSSVEQSKLGVVLLEVLANIELGRTREAQQQLAMADSMARAADRHLATAQRVGLDDLIAREQALADAARTSIRAVTAWAALGVLVAPLVLLLLRRRFYGPLADLTDGIQQVADGDLTWTIPVRRSDELGRLSDHFNRATAVLRQRAEETQERAQAALRQSEERYETMVKSAPIGIAIVDSDGRYVHTNPALQRFLGYSEAELRGKSFRDVTLPEDISASDRGLALLIADSSDRYHLEKRYQRKDGALVWARVAVAAVRDAKGTLLHTVSMIEDITDEKSLEADKERAEEARQKSEEMFATAFRMSPNASVIARLDDGLLVDVNEAYCRTSGFAREEVLGKRASEVLWPDPERREDFINQLRAQGRLRDAKLKMRTKFGPQLDVLVSIEMIDLDGVPHTLGSAVDITSLEQASEALRQSEEKFAKAFGSSPNSILITEFETGVLVDANEAFTATTGYTRAEAIGRSTLELLWPQPEQRAEVVAKLEKDGRIQGMEVVLKHKSGGVVQALIFVELMELGGRRYLLSEALDITERKRVNEALRESEQRFRRLVQDMSIGVALLDSDGRVLHANPAARDILSLTDAELNEPGFWKTGMGGLQEDGTPFPTDERPVLKAVRNKTPLRNVLIGVPSRGRAEARWTLVNVDPQIDPDGTVRNFIVWFSDVTEQRKADQQLRLLAQAVKSTTEIITITDRQGRFTFVNRAFLEKTGYTEQEVLGQTVDLIVAKRNPAELQEQIRAATERGGWSGELYNRRKDGSEFAIALTTAQVKDSKGRVIALMGVASDITDRKAAERQLRLLAQAVKSTSESISITDADGHFTFVNRGFIETCGYTEAELLGQHVSLIDSPRNPTGLQDEVRKVTMARGTWSGELYNRRKNGTDFLVGLTTAQVKDETGRVIALMGVSSDITERKQLEDSLRRSETMSALGAVVAGVAHEVRNPLFGISGTVDAFEARFGAQPGYERYAKTLRQEVGRLTKLMQDLLEYGKPARLDVALGVVAPVVRRAAAACTALADSSGVTVHVDVADDLPHIPMDPSRIQQVFQNLIENAIQHSARGGRVTITASPWRDRRPPREMLEIAVIDEGTGLREEDLPRLFEPFFTRRRGGTGLGLSIVHRILEQHGGDIDARNGAVRGAVMAVHLPLKSELANVAPEPARAEA